MESSNRDKRPLVIRTSAPLSIIPLGDSEPSGGDNLLDEKAAFMIQGLVSDVGGTCKPSTRNAMHLKLDLFNLQYEGALKPINFFPNMRKEVDCFEYLPDYEASKRLLIDGRWDGYMFFTSDRPLGEDFGIDSLIHRANYFKEHSEGKLTLCFIPDIDWFVDFMEDETPEQVMAQLEQKCPGVFFIIADDGGDWI